MLMRSANSCLSFWRRPSLTSNPFGILLRVILRQSQNSTFIFLKGGFVSRDTFPWLPEPQTCMPFQTLPSSSLKMMSLKPCGVYIFSKRKLMNVITPYRVLQCEQLVGFYSFRKNRNNSMLTLMKTHNRTTITQTWMGTLAQPSSSTWSHGALLIPAAFRNWVWLMTRVSICYFHKLAHDLRLLQQSWWLNSKVGTVVWILFCSALNPECRGKRGDQTNGQSTIATVFPSAHSRLNSSLENKSVATRKARIETTAYRCHL